MRNVIMPEAVEKNNSQSNIRLQACLLSLLVIILDQITKFLSLQFLKFDEPLVIFPGFDLILRFNQGAAFSFLGGASGWQRWFFVIVAIVMIIGIYIWLGKLKKEDLLERLALGLILGGALGNLIDRMIHGHVIDFISWYYKSYVWPTFNVADSAICVGVFLLALDIFKKR